MFSLRCLRSTELSRKHPALIGRVAHGLKATPVFPIQRFHSSGPSSTNTDTAASSVPDMSSLDSALNEIGQSMIAGHSSKWYESLISFQQLWSGDLIWYNYIVKSGQVVLETAQYVTGAPWWAVIILSSVFFRVLLSPIQVKTLRYSTLLQKVAPEVRQKTLEFSSKQQARKAAGLPADSAVSHWNISSAIYAKHGLNPLGTMKLAAIQMPFFVILFFSIRDMCFDPAFHLQLSMGGASWFTDLTVPDEYYILPALCSLSMLSIFETQSRLTGQVPGLMMKWFPRVLAIGLLGVSSQFPSGVCLYWITSSLAMFAFNGLFFLPQVRERFGVPPIHSSKPQQLSPMEVRSTTVDPAPQNIKASSLKKKKK